MEFCDRCGSRMGRTKEGYVCPRCGAVVQAKLEMQLMKERIGPTLGVSTCLASQQRIICRFPGNAQNAETNRCSIGFRESRESTRASEEKEQ